MKATIKNGVLTIEIPVNATPQPSTSGKTLLVASSHGGRTTDAKVGDKNIVVSLNAYVPNEAYQAPAK